MGPYLEIRSLQCGQVKMRSDWARVDPKSNDRHPSKKREIARRDTHRGKKPCEDRDRDWGEDAATSQGIPGFAATTRSWKRHRGCSPAVFRGTSPAHTLNSDFGL